MTNPIGILGGTFDPVHHGHLRLALECLEGVKLAEVRLIPVYAPPHRSPPVATPSQRLRMLELATEDVAGLVPDGRELERGGRSYTVDTLESLRAELPDTPLCLVMGMDAFAQLDTWSRWTSLADYAHIIVVDRPGNEAEIPSREVSALLDAKETGSPRDLGRAPGGSILRITLPMLDISSTRIRSLIAAGRNPGFLIPPKVNQYIARERLYLYSA